MKGVPARTGKPRGCAASIAVTALLACAAVLSGCRKSSRTQGPALRPPEAAVAGSTPVPGAAAIGPESEIDESGREPDPENADTGFFEDMDTSSFLEIDVRYVGSYHPPLEPGRVAILIPGGYHRDEVPEGAEEAEWLALHADSAGGYRLSRAGIRIGKFYDPILDQDSASPTGKSVIVRGVAEPIKLLVSGPGFLSASAVDTADIAAGAFGPGYRRAFWFRGVQYELSFERHPGGTSPEDGGTGWSILLSVDDAGRDPERLLLDRVGADGGAELVFAGDLDGDGRLDLILNQTRENVIADVTLFLSRPAGERVLKAVGVFLAVGC